MHCNDDLTETIVKDEVKDGDLAILSREIKWVDLIRTQIM
jgi:hypothetical protein